MVMERIAALDPGREKCGFAVLAEGGEVLMQRVIETAQLEEEVRVAREAYGFAVLVEGNGTTSRERAPACKRLCRTFTSRSATSTERRTSPRRRTGRPSRRAAGAACCPLPCRYRRNPSTISSPSSSHRVI